MNGGIQQQKTRLIQPTLLSTACWCTLIINSAKFIPIAKNDPIDKSKNIPPTFAIPNATAPPSSLAPFIESKKILNIPDI